MMRRVNNIALFAAFLWAMLFVMSSCATLPSARIQSTRRGLGTLRFDVTTLTSRYERAVQKQLEACAAKNLATPQERHDCLGDLAPDSALSQTIDQLITDYDLAAKTLKQLEQSLLLVEQYEQQGIL